MTSESFTLRHVRLFRRLGDEEIRRLDTRCMWRRYDAKEEVLGHGDAGTDLYFVVSGLVRAVIHANGGREVILGDIGPGEFFGELAAIDGRPRSASIVAVIGATLARMPAGTFREMLYGHADVCSQVLALLASRIRLLDTRVSEFATLDVKRRIFAELLRLSRPAADSRRAVVSPPPSHAEIAARIGARREAVTLGLGALEDAGLLERRGGTLVLTDLPALVAIMQHPRESTA